MKFTYLLVAIIAIISPALGDEDASASPEVVNRKAIEELEALKAQLASTVSKLQAECTTSTSLAVEAKHSECTIALESAAKESDNVMRKIKAEVTDCKIEVDAAPEICDQKLAVAQAECDKSTELASMLAAKLAAAECKMSMDDAANSCNDMIQGQSVECAKKVDATSKEVRLTQEACSDESKELKQRIAELEAELFATRSSLNIVPFLQKHAKSLRSWTAEIVSDFETNHQPKMIAYVEMVIVEANSALNLLKNKLLGLWAQVCAYYADTIIPAMPNTPAFVEEAKAAFDAEVLPVLQPVLDQLVVQAKKATVYFNVAADIGIKETRNTFAVIMHNCRLQRHNAIQAAADFIPAPQAAVALDAFAIFVAMFIFLFVLLKPIYRLIIWVLCLPFKVLCCVFCCRGCSKVKAKPVKKAGKKKGKARKNKAKKNSLKNKKGKK